MIICKDYTLVSSLCSDKQILWFWNLSNAKTACITCVGINSKNRNLECTNCIVILMQLYNNENIVPYLSRINH